MLNHRKNQGSAVFDQRHISNLPLQWSFTIFDALILKVELFKEKYVVTQKIIKNHIDIFLMFSLIAFICIKSNIDILGPDFNFLFLELTFYSLIYGWSSSNTIWRLMRSFVKRVWSLMDRGFLLGGLGQMRSDYPSLRELPELKEGI